MVLILNDPRVIEYNARQNYLAGDSRALINLLESDEPLSAELRTFVAGILEGKIKKKLGVKPRRGTLAEAAKAWLLKMEVEEAATFMLMKQIADAWDGRPPGSQGARRRTRPRVKKTDAWDEALHKVADRHGMTPARLDKLIYPRKPKKPKTK